jgi:very-short-patch-repair endonuclease
MLSRNWKTISQLCRELRQRGTHAERKLWSYLRNKQLDGIKFYRQKPLIYEESFNRRYFYIADFYTRQKRLVIELDGPSHELKKEYDKNRDIVINGRGLRVLRLKNEEMEDVEQALDKIRSYF